MKYLSYLALLTLISACGTGSFKREIDPDGGYRTSGVEQFFLPELPNWANFSGAGGCYKSSSFHYLNFPKLIESYQLTYPQMIELQAQYNERLENYYRSTAVRFLKPVEEASFFSNTLEQVRGGVKSLKLPPVNQVEVIWLESYSAAEIKKMAHASRFDETLPILYSSCHSKQSLAQWIATEGLEDVGFYTITGEWLSPYNVKGELGAGLRLHLEQLLGPKIKVKLNSNNNKPFTELL